MTGPYYGEVQTNLRQAVKEKRGECWPEVRCCCTVLLRRTCLELQSRTSGLSSCLTHLTHPTWHPATSTYFDTWSSTFAERGFSMTISMLQATCPRNSIWLE